jgi:hypothetical protein
VDKYVFTRRPLDESVPFGAVEPLYCSLLSHRTTVSFRGLRLSLPADHAEIEKVAALSLPADTKTSTA